MEEERFIKSEADDQTRLIVSRLGERQRKWNRMQEMEVRLQKPHTRHRRMFIVSAMAASVILALVVWPLYQMQRSPLDKLDIGKPTMTEFRAASPELNEISQLMEKEDYQQAMIKTKEALRKSDRVISEFGGLGSMLDDEELMYEERLDAIANCELRWTYIYILVRMEQYKEAKKQIKRYLKDKDICEHYEEARALLQELK